MTFSPKIDLVEQPERRVVYWAIRHPAQSRRRPELRSLRAVVQRLTRPDDVVFGGVCAAVYATDS